jgi:hypothetical protein
VKPSYIIAHGIRSLYIYIKEVEVGGTCGTHGGGERYLPGSGCEARR